MYQFEDVKNKFVLVNTEDGLVIYIGRCIFHKDLVSETQIKQEKVLGGGEWDLNRETGKLKLFGESHDFGYLRIETIKPVLESGEFYERHEREFRLKDKIKEIEFQEVYPFKYLNLIFDNGKGKVL